MALDEETLQRTLEERALLISGLEHPGFQLLMAKLDKAADDMLDKYDECNFFTQEGIETAQKIQAFRRVIKTEIPMRCEAIINVEKPKVKWTFKEWISSVFRVRAID